uniref:Uncharacterized protein MANES_03G001100 n=1 Tax=Rhizophora mucronata TaxID=61149 RepID=A0A2P2MS78_RHIMU
MPFRSSTSQLESASLIVLRASQASVHYVWIPIDVRVCSIQKILRTIMT